MSRSLILVSLLTALGSGLTQCLAQVDIASNFLDRARKSQQAGKYEEAGNLYAQAAQAYKAKGQTVQEADAASLAASMYEKQADQILGGIDKPKISAKAPQVPVAPAKAPPVVKKLTELKLRPLAPRPGYVIGRAFFADGRSIPEFTVSVAGYDAHSDDAVTQGAAGTVGTATGHGGTYALRTVDAFSHTKPTNALVVQISAQTKVIYKGESYQMDLCPLDGKGDTRDAKGNGKFSAPGLTRDFVLKIAGLIPGKDDSTPLARQNAYYGQRLYLDDWAGSGPTLRGAEFKGGNIVVTLTPQGPLLDGSIGQTLVRQIPISAIGTESAYVLDVPIGPYSVQAQVVTGGVSKPLVVHWAEGDQSYGSAAVLTPHPYGAPPSVLTGATPLVLQIKP